MGQMEYREWVEMMQFKGEPLAEYPCPNCKKTIHAAIPSKGHTYTSAVTCPYCDCLHFKIVEENGTVTINGGRDGEIDA